MKRRRFKRGDTVRVSKRAWNTHSKRGKIGTIVTRPERFCTDYHKSHYETLCTVEFAGGKRRELAVKELRPAGAVDQLASLTR